MVEEADIGVTWIAKLTVGAKGDELEISDDIDTLLQYVDEQTRVTI